MKLQVQVIANNILQSVPSIYIQSSHGTKFNKMIFNIPEQHTRYAPNNKIIYTPGMSVFFTKFSAGSMAGLMKLFLQLNNNRDHNMRCFNTKLYVNDGMYNYWAKLRKFLGIRIIPYSWFNLQNGQCTYGIRTHEQFRELGKIDKKKLFRASFNNQDLIQHLKSPSNASQNIQIKKQRISTNSIKYIYKNETIEIQTFKITNQKIKHETTYNYICVVKQIPKSIDKKKINQFKQIQNLTKQQYISLMKNKQVTLKNGQTKHLCQFQIPQYHPSSSNFIILHYNSSENIQKIMTSQSLTNYLNKNESYSTNSVIHIIQGDASLISSQSFVSLKKMINQSSPKCKHLVYHKFMRFYETAQEYQKQLIKFYPNFTLCKLMNRKVGNILPNILANCLQLFQLYINNEKNKLLLSQPIVKQLILYKPRHYLVIAPIRDRGYCQIQGTVQTKQSDFQSKNTTNNNIEKQHIQALKQKLKRSTKICDPTIIFLGTSSMVSTYHRNVSGIMVKFPKIKQKQNVNIQQEQTQWSIIMDCGQGIYDQFVHQFGIHYKKQLTKVRVLFITHMHQDHCAGVFNFISQRNKVLRQFSIQNCKLYLVIPVNMAQWYHLFIQQIQNLQQNCEVVFTQSIKSQEVKKEIDRINKSKVGVFSKINIDTSKNNSKIMPIKNNGFQDIQFKTMDMCLGSDEVEMQQQQQQKPQNLAAPAQIPEIYKQRTNKTFLQFQNFLKQNKLYKFTPVPVAHCRQSYGIILEHDLFKISYSGDCRPTSAFIKLAKNSTLMIHESTFQSHEKQLAKLSAHSTTSEAIQVGYKSSSLFTALTHFGVRHGMRLNKKQQKNEKFAKNKQNIGKDEQKQNNLRNYQKLQTFKCVDHLIFKLSELHRIPQLCKQIQCQNNN